LCFVLCFFFSSRRRHTRFSRDWSSDVCSSDLDCCKYGTLFRVISGQRRRTRCFALFTIVCLVDAVDAVSSAGCDDSSPKRRPKRRIPSIRAIIALKNALSPLSVQLRRYFTRYANWLITLSALPIGYMPVVSTPCSFSHSR